MDALVSLMNCHQNSYKRSLFWDYWMTLHVILFDLCRTASCWYLRFNLTSCFHIQGSGMQLRDSSFSLYDLSPIDFNAIWWTFGFCFVSFCPASGFLRFVERMRVGKIVKLLFWVLDHQNSSYRNSLSVLAERRINLRTLTIHRSHVQSSSIHRWSIAEISCTILEQHSPIIHTWTGTSSKMVEPIPVSQDYVPVVYTRHKLGNRVAVITYTKILCDPYRCRRTRPKKSKSNCQFLTV